MAGGLTISKKRKDFSLKEITDWFKKYIFPIGGVVILGIITYFVYIPFAQEIPTLYQQKSQLEKNLGTLNDNVAILKRFSSMPLDMMQTKMDSVIPREINISRLVGEIESLGRSAGLSVFVPNEKEQVEKIERLIAGEHEMPESEEANVIPVPIRIKVSGTRNGIEKFLTSIRKGSLLLSLTKAKIDVDEKGNWNADLQISAYISPVPIEYTVKEQQVIDPNSPKIYQKVMPLTINVSEERYNNIMNVFTQP